MEVAGGADSSVAFFAEQFDEPGFVFDLLLEDARCHVVRFHVRHRDFLFRVLFQFMTTKERTDALR